MIRIAISRRNVKICEIFQLCLSTLTIMYVESPDRGQTMSVYLSNKYWLYTDIQCLANAEHVLVIIEIECRVQSVHSFLHLQSILFGRASNFLLYVKLVSLFGGFVGWNHLRVDCVTIMKVFFFKFVTNSPLRWFHLANPPKCETTFPCS